MDTLTSIGSSLRRLLPLALGATLLLGLASACTDDDVDPTLVPDDPNGEATEAPTTPPGTETLTPTAPAPQDGAGAGGLTGIDELDEIVQAVNDGDVDALMERTLTEAIPCGTETGAGGPPQCEEGDQNGTPYEVFAVVGCEGGWTDDPEQLWNDFLPNARGLYAATEAAFETSDIPQAEAYLVFHREAMGDAPGGARLHVDGNGQIVAYWEGCQATVEELIQFDNQDLEILAGPFEAQAQ